MKHHVERLRKRVPFNLFAKLSAQLELNNNNNFPSAGRGKI